jgi:hypothetical protein
MVGEISLTRGMVVIVDNADFDWLNQFKWYAHEARNTFYAARKELRADGKEHMLKMHRLIMDAQPKMIVDHRDGNGLNNQRLNLRVASDQQNKCNRPAQSNNTSGFKGVSWSKASGKWLAQIASNGEHKYLGLYLTPLDAAYAYNEAAKELHGEFARLNNV